MISHKTQTIDFPQGTGSTDKPAADTRSWPRRRLDDFQEQLINRPVAATTKANTDEENRMPLTTLALFFLISLVSVTVIMLSVGADVALAQDDGAQINDAITAARNWLTTIIVSVGGVALLMAIIVWMFSGSESRRAEGAVRWIGRIIVGMVAGLMIPAIIALLQGFAGA